jgi:hypothetical protein
MDSFYLGCVIVGGSVMVIQFLLSLAGLGGGHESDVSHDVGAGDAGGHDVTDHHGDHGGHDPNHGSWFAGMLSLRAVTAAVAFFGIGGLAASARQVSEPLPIVIAAAAAGAALFMVAWVMRGLHRLQADGTVRIERAVGAPGTVYLSVPGQKAGVGKVTVSVQNRTMEYHAVTAAPEGLVTGAKVVVVAVLGPGTVEVAPAVS